VGQAKRMRLILFGPPGAGKGTQARYICEHWGIAHVSTGDIVRAAILAGTPAGQRVKETVQAGNLVPDAIILDLMTEHLESEACAAGFLLDGFPRTIAQAEVLEKLGISIDCVLELSVPDQTIIDRLSGRRLHPSSGRVYHSVFNPPKEPDKDDVTGEPLIQRADDQPNVVLDRLKIYHEQTEPLIAWFRSRSYCYHAIDGQGDVASVRTRLLEVLATVPISG